MKMSVFRRGEATTEMDHLTCLEFAVDDEGVQMIMYAQLHDQAVLVGLKGGEAILKPWMDDDHRLSFDLLYDTCISLREFRRMREAKVTKPQDLPPHLYEVRVGLEASPAPAVSVRLKASNDIEMRRKLMQLVNHDADFRAQLITAWILFMMTDGGDCAVLHNGGVKVELNAPADAPEWEVLKPT